MKRTNLYQLFVVIFFSVSFSAFSAESGSKEPVYISGTKFTYPLIEKWITEYNKQNPGVNIQLATKSSSQNVELNVIAHRPGEKELQPDQEVIYAGKYALLPVTNSHNPNLAAFARKGLSKKEIDKLFFEVIDFDRDEPAEKSKFQATIYARDNKACTSNALAGYFGHQSSEIRGKKVFGDDIYLLSALKKDSIGLSYNTLSYVFDTNSRNLKAGLAILPVDLRKDTKVILNGSLDDVLAALEKTQVETIPVERIGFVVSQQSARKEVTAFLKWVLSEGQQYNHKLGFLTLDKNVAAEQSVRLNEKLLTLK